MMPPVIFICYKKILTRERDGKIIERQDSNASILHHLLKESKLFEPWMDEAELGAGMTWESEIYRRILISDVLIVLIGVGTSGSQWVQREIALANALGISVVPLGTDLTWAEMERELKALGIEHLQGKITNNIKLHSGPALIDEVQLDLARAVVRTKKQQEQTLRELLTRRDVKHPKAADNKSAATFEIDKAGSHLTLHISAGDIAKVRGVDVFVNSENDYMQMARFYESKTISSTLRRMGAMLRDGRYEDTIQHELDLQLGNRSRPVQYAEVFVTSSGGPNSVLAKENRARFILHVAAVQSVLAEASVVPFKQPFQIEACVRAVLAKFVELNRADGIISPAGSDARTEQEERARRGEGKSKSLIFPLFGTGRGGNSIDEVLGPMLDGIVGFWGDCEDELRAYAPQEIYLSGYTTQDVEDLKKFLNAWPGISTN